MYNELSSYVIRVAFPSKYYVQADPGSLDLPRATDGSGTDRSHGGRAEGIHGAWWVPPPRNWIPPAKGCRVYGDARDALPNFLESCSVALNMESRNIALLGALLFICRPAAAFVSVSGPVTASNGGAGLSAPRSPSAPWNEHARGQQPVSSLAGRRSRAGTALSMGAKSVRACAVAWRGRVGGPDAFVCAFDGGPDGPRLCVRSRTAARMICMSRSIMCNNDRGVVASW